MRNLGLTKLLTLVFLCLSQSPAQGATATLPSIPTFSEICERLLGKASPSAADEPILLRQESSIVRAIVAQRRAIVESPAFKKRGYVPAEFYAPLFPEMARDVAVVKEILVDLKAEVPSQNNIRHALENMATLAAQELAWMESLKEVPMLEFVQLAHDVAQLNEIRALTADTGSLASIDYKKFMEYRTRGVPQMREHPSLPALYLPTYRTLSIDDINALTAHGIYPLGMAREPTLADGKIRSPYAFFAHDLVHAGAVQDELFPMARRQELFSKYVALARRSDGKDLAMYKLFWFELFHELAIGLYGGEKKFQELVRNEQKILLKAILERLTPDEYGPHFATTGLPTEAELSHGLNDFLQHVNE